jgi:hypothetical protein
MRIKFGGLLGRNCAAMPSVVCFSQMESQRRGLRGGFGVANIVGLLALAGLMMPISLLVRSTGYSVWLWILGYPAVAGCCLYAWHSDRGLTEPSRNLKSALASVFLGSVSFGVDAMVTTWMYPKLPLSQAIWHAGSPFGIAFTLFLCPAMTMFYLAGAARAQTLRGNATMEHVTPD